MGETEIVIKAAELDRMTIGCPACGSELTVNERNGPRNVLPVLRVEAL